MKSSGVKNRIEKKIKEAFDDREYPKGEKLTRHRSNEVSICLESEEIEIFLFQLEWKNLNLDLLNNSYRGDFTALHNFLTDRAFSYYLPAFLIIILEDYEGSDLLADNIISVFAYGRDEDKGDAENQLSCLFLNQVKIDAVIEFLSYIDETYGEDFGNEISLAIKNLLGVKKR